MVLLVLNIVSSEKVIVVVKEDNFLGFNLNSEEKVLRGVEFSKENDFEELNAFSGEIDSKNLEKLRKKKVEIYEDRSFKVFLDESVDQINATKVWDLSVNITGKDVGVCVIDTGINYLHPDFGCLQEEYDNESCRVFGYDFVNDDGDVMDDNGHGTHVSGIVGANGGIKGVSPDVNIVMAKACDGRDCSLLDVIESLDYCINNKERYNISVISMSLGEGVYNNDCPFNKSYYSIMEYYINLAYKENIFIVVSSGNDGVASGIAYPACSPNVTAVGAVDDDDKLASFGNTGNYLYRGNGNNILRLLAPGVNISSTLGDSYDFMSGTSMSAPHVAGAAALLRQYKKYEGNEISNLELENVLSDTGKPIYDSRSKFTFSRIDVYSALIEIDSKKPILTAWKEPIIVNIKDNVTFYSEIEEVNLDKVWLEVDFGNESRNYSGSEVFIESDNFIVNQTVKWKFYALDKKGNLGNSSLESFNVGNNLGPRIISYEPNESINIFENESLEFRVEVSDWNNDSLDYTWYLNDVNKSNKENFSWYFDFDSLRNYNVSVFVSDGELNDSREWRINVSDVNRAPVLWINDLVGVENEWFEYILNGSDLDGDNLSYESDFFEINGSLVKFFVENVSSRLVNVSVSDGWLFDSEVISFNVTDRPLIISYEPNGSVEMNEGLLEFIVNVSDEDELSYGWFVDGVNKSEEENFSYSFSEGNYNVSFFVEDIFGIGESLKWGVEVSKVVESSSEGSSGGGGGSRGGRSVESSPIVASSVPSFVVESSVEDSVESEGNVITGDVVKEDSDEGLGLTGRFVKNVRENSKAVGIGLIFVFLVVVGFVVFRMKSHVKV